MPFHCRLAGPDRAVAVRRVADQAEETDSEEVVIMAACGVLGDTDARFHIGGFGLEDWNFDVRYDLSVFLEQLSEAVRQLNTGREATIEIYSQGAERVLTFRPTGDDVRIICTSGTAWVPDPSEEVLPNKTLVTMFTRLATDFAQAVSHLDEDAARLEPIRRWSHGDV